MRLLELSGYLFLIMFLSYIVTKRGEARHRARSRYAHVGPTKKRGPPPVTPEPTYICKNCGMLIHTGHGHTLEECEAYANDPTCPDSRAHRTIMKRRNAPRIREPYYHKPGTFRNWGAGIALDVES